MNAKDPAFPVAYYDFQPGTGEQVVREQFFGLTKRELFAAMVLQGMVSNPDTRTTYEEKAHKALMNADALILALGKEQS